MNTALNWILFVAAQIKNSLQSKTNGLTEDSAGVKKWLSGHVVDLAIRAFFSMLGYGFIVHTVAARIGGAGFGVTATTIAGVGGFSANSMLYQFFGMFPGLRVEVSDLAPPPAAGIMPQSQLNSNSPLGAKQP